jgi:hypothetical protein
VNGFGTGLRPIDGLSVWFRDDDGPKVTGWRCRLRQHGGGLTDAKTDQQAKRRNRGARPVLACSAIRSGLVSFNRGEEGTRKAGRKTPIIPEN